MSWPTVELGTLGEVSAGGTPSRSKHQYWGKGYKWLSIRDYKDFDLVTATKEEITEEGLAKSSAKLFPEGTVIISIFATLGRVGVLGEAMATNQAIAGIRCNSQVDKTYLMYCLKSKLADIERQSGGVAQKNINLSILKGLKIPLPPLAVQKQIAAVLEKADTLRGQCQQMEQELNTLAQSVFLELFGDPVKNPKGWEFKTVSQIIRKPLQNGAYYEKDKYVESGIEMAHMGDTFNGLIKRGSIKRVEAPTKDIEKYAITSEDILVSRRSLVYEGAAKPCMIPTSVEPLIYESSMIRVCPDHEVVLPEYLFHFLSNPRAREVFLFKYVTKSTISGINQTNLAKVEVMVPPIKLQLEFLNALKAKDELSIYIDKSIEEKNQFFNSLMQRAFKGELELKDVA